MGEISTGLVINTKSMLSRAVTQACIFGGLALPGAVGCVGGESGNSEPLPVAQDIDDMAYYSVATENSIVEAICAVGDNVSAHPDEPPEPSEIDDMNFVVLEPRNQKDEVGGLATTTIVAGAQNQEIVSIWIGQPHLGKRMPNGRVAHMVGINQCVALAGPDGQPIATDVEFVGDEVADDVPQL